MTLPFRLPSSPLGHRPTTWNDLPSSKAASKSLTECRTPLSTSNTSPMKTQSRPSPILPRSRSVDELTTATFALTCGGMKDAVTALTATMRSKGVRYVSILGLSRNT